MENLPWEIWSLSFQEIREQILKRNLAWEELMEQGTHERLDLRKLQLKVYLLVSWTKGHRWFERLQKAEYFDHSSLQQLPEMS
jgi:hypothetical protein